DNPFGDNPFKDLAKKNPFKDNPFKDIAKDNPFKDNPFKDLAKDNPFGDNSKPQKPLTLAEHLKNLQSGDDRAKSQAVNFFQKQDPNVPERADVAKALDGYAQATNGRIDVARVLGIWATKDQAPTLVSYVTDTDFGRGDRRQAAMGALGELKDERGVEPTIN